MRLALPLPMLPLQQPMPPLLLLLLLREELTSAHGGPTR
jgi:hypothetical protein